ncbi:popeye domain-containing protein 3-like [Amphiura filiformis]|uniref:popeye domain-containing protein 3-like n=1 Tax=Amphiura filiformis TaxID=82378 RepID=UPI003B21FA08
MAASNDSGPFSESLSDCNWLSPAESGIYQLGCFIFVNGFLAPPTAGLAQTVWLRSCLAIGSFCHILWAAPARCWPDAFGWNIGCFLLNISHLIYVVYLVYPIRFDDDIEKIYSNMFQPFEIGKQKFRTLLESHGAIYELDATGKYAVERITPTGKQMALLVSGRMRVTVGGRFLHHIYPGQFIDSPEWQSAIQDERSTLFQVTIISDTNCRYIQWKRSSLESFLRREPFFRTVFESYVGKDITNKLYAVNDSLDGPSPPPQSPSSNSQDQPILEPLNLGSEDALLLHKWERVNSDDEFSSAPASPVLKEAGSWYSVHSDRSMVDIRASIASGRGADVTGQKTPRPSSEGFHNIDDYSPGSPPESPRYLLPPGSPSQFYVSSF